MPVTVTPEPATAAVAFPPRKKWTRRECELAEKAGAFDGQRYELVEGELIDKMGALPPHSWFLTLLAGWLMRAFGESRVRNQMPIDVRPEDNPTSRPQPDLCLVTEALREYRYRDPVASEIRLLIEVADSSYAFDMSVKADLYARAGIAEYWVADVSRSRIIVHRTPADGRYQSVTAYASNERVAPLASPETSFCLADLE